VSRLTALRAALTAVVVAAATMLGGLPAQAADTGYVGPVYGSATTAPTGQKPQSKLWVTDGTWWGALFDRTSGDFHIFRYDWAANTWTDTGVLVDERTNVYLDALWDGQHLYVVSAGTGTTNTLHRPRLTRFSYSSTTQAWTRDPGFPVMPPGNGGVKSAVIAKDSTGQLWATWFAGSKIWVTHAQPGDDKTWVTPYQLPTPAGQSSVGTDDLSAIVAFDGNKIGVLFSNQLSTSETMYWSWHQDGTSDQLWNLQVAYQQPEGADDHINLKSLVGDSAGRVFAVAKTSMDAGSDPLFNLLTLSLSGQWSSDVVWTQADDSTRAIVQIDTTSRQVYVFGAAPCCSGGTIYYKKAPLDNPQFSPGLGTPFIHSDAHPEANNPTSTKQVVNSATDLVVMAGDDQTRTYLYNRMELGPAGPDTTPPQTTITNAPPATTGSTDASFSFTSNESGSTFACSLDGAPAQACSSPQDYSGLGLGSHTFTVAATDSSGNTDQSPATHTWSVEQDTTPPQTTITSAPPASTSSTSASFEFSSSESGSSFACSLDGAPAQACTSPQAYSGLSVGSHTFSVAATDGAGNTDPTPATHTWSAGATTVVFSEDFSSGGFTAGGWQVQTGNGATATVVDGAVTAGNLGARLLSTTASNSSASLRKALGSRTSLTLEWDARVVSANTNQSFTLAKVYGSGRVLSLVRNGSSGALSVQDTATTVATGASVPTGQVVRLRLSVTNGTAGTVRLSVNGTEVFSRTMNLGTSALTAVRMGDDAKRRAHDYRVDTILVTTP
jgi:hypothetical protein